MLFISHIQWHISVEKRELIIAHMKTNNIWDYMGMIYATLKKRL